MNLPLWLAGKTEGLKPVLLPLMAGVSVRRSWGGKICASSYKGGSEFLGTAVDGRA